MAKNSVSSFPSRLETTTIDLDDDDDDSTPSYEMPKLIAVWSLADAAKETIKLKEKKTKLIKKGKRNKKKKPHTKAERRAQREYCKRKREVERECLRREKRQASEQKYMNRKARRALKQQKIMNQESKSQQHKHRYSNCEPILIEDDEPSPQYIRTVNINKLLANCGDVPQPKSALDPVTSSHMMQTPLPEQDVFILRDTNNEESYGAVLAAPGVAQIIGSITDSGLSFITLDNMTNIDINGNSATGKSVFNDAEIRILNRFCHDDGEVIISDDISYLQCENSANTFQNCMNNLQKNMIAVPNVKNLSQNSLNTITIPINFIQNNIKTHPNITNCIQNSTPITAMPLIIIPARNTNAAPFSAISSKDLTNMASSDVVTIDDDEVPPPSVVKTRVAGSMGTVELMKIRGGGSGGCGAVDWEDEIPMDFISVVN